LVQNLIQAAVVILTTNAIVFDIKQDCVTKIQTCANRGSMGSSSAKGVGMIRAEIGLKYRQILNKTYSFHCLLIL